MQSSKDTLTALLSSPIAKAIGTAFIIGVAWNRLEYKFDQTSDKLLKKIDEHIIADGFEKKMISDRVDKLKELIDDLRAKVYEYEYTEFIKPEEHRIKKRKN